jgi:ribosomal 50S subunit-recycling heat shock protein
MRLSIFRKEVIYLRLDKYLKVSRIIKRRTIANDACDAGRVTVNEKVARASYEVKIGDLIEIRFGNNITKVEVLSLKESVRKEEASGMFKSL